MISCDTMGRCVVYNDFGLDFLIGFLVVCWLSILLMFLYSVFKILSKSWGESLDCENISDTEIVESDSDDCSTDSYRSDDTNLVTIIRGVPGIGKDYCAYTKELGMEGLFTICSMDEYFYKKTGKYEFNRNEINRAERECTKMFVKALINKIPRIYLTSIYSKKWEYRVYSDIAKWYGYRIKLIELECVSDDHIKYYNKRSLHNYPMTLSRKLFKEWEFSEEGKILEPYNGDLPGDSLPFPVKTKKELDQELDKYMEGGVNRGIIYDKQKYKSKSLVQFISNEDILIINKRKINVYKD